MVFKITSSCSTNDSLLFSRTGNFVLERNNNYDFINGCSCKYWKLYEIDKNESTYTVVFENDSVYFLQYQEPGMQTGRVFKTMNNNNETCKTLASISKVLSLAAYDSVYQFSLNASLSTDTVTFTNKTIHIRSEAIASADSDLDPDSLDIYDDDDSTLHFDINIRLLFNNEKLIDDTITTTIPQIEHHYKIYYSPDNNFYFLRGWYSYSTNIAIDAQTNPGRRTRYYSSVLNKIGKKKRTG